MSFQIDWISYFLGVLTLLLFNFIVSPIILRKAKRTIGKTTKEIEELEKKFAEVEQNMATLEGQSKEDLEKLKTLVRLLKARRKCPYCNQELPVFTMEGITDK